MSTDWLRELHSPGRHQRQLDRLQTQLFGTRRLYALTHQGVSLAEMMSDRARLVALLTRAVRTGGYRMSPARVREVQLDKMRELFCFEAIDFVLHGVAGSLIAEAIEPMLSAQLFSYRKGRSPWQAIRQFAEYARRHRAAEKDPRARGIYVFRGDIRNYTDSIVLGESAPLWPMLKRVLGVSGAEPQWGLMEQMARPTIVHDDGTHSTRSRGLPMGSPITPPIANLYLHELDAALDSVPEAFYARFGDDILFAHCDPEVVREGCRTIDTHLLRHELELNAAKRKLLFFNGAGRPSSSWAEAQGANHIVFLGCEIRFDGTIALPREKWRALLHDVRARIVRSAKLLRASPIEERAAALCAIVNEAVDPRSAFAEPHAARLRDLVTNREQLAQFDYLVARMIAEALLPGRGVRAFREFPPRVLRQRFGLASLVVLRNAPTELIAPRK